MVTDLPTPKYFCPYSEQTMSVFPDFWQDFLRIHQQSVKIKVSKVNFSINKLVTNSVWTHIFNLIQRHYTWTTLFCLCLRKSFSIEDRRTLCPNNNAPCVLLSLMPTCPSLKGCCLSEFVSLVSCILPPLHRFCAATYHKQLQIQTRPV